MINVVDGWCRAHPGKVGRIHIPGNHEKADPRPLQYHDYSQVFCYTPYRECMRASLENGLSCFSTRVAIRVLKVGSMPNSSFRSVANWIAINCSQFIFEHCQQKDVTWQQ